MTENDIKGNFIVIKNLASQAAGADLTDSEREVIKTLVAASLNLLEGLLLDINRIANCAEEQLRRQQ